MVNVRPFRGLRPVPEKVGDVASPPYDVLNSEEARRLADGNPVSFLHVVKPEIDLPPSVDLYSEKVYEKGRENLDRLVSDGILIRDPEPAFYLYRLIMGEIEQTGLVAGASIEDYENDRIKKHELTRADKEADRIRHVDRLNANTGPVFLTYRARPEMDRMTERITESPPLYDFTGDDGVRHTLWKVDDPETLAGIEDLFERIDFLYVADGHHRSASGTAVGKQRREADPHHTGEEDYNYFLAVIFPHDRLNIMDYNRVVKDLNGLSPEEFLEKISDSFEIVEKTGPTPARPRARHTFGMYLKGEWYLLKARPGCFDEGDPVQSLDVSILQNNLLSPVLGIENPREDDRIDFVGGIRGLEELARRVDEGEAVAFALYPTSIEELMAIADAGKMMPPKSTWFEPKLRSGVIVHPLE